MLSRKSKGLFVEANSFSVLMAVTSSTGTPLTVEQLKEYPPLFDDGSLHEDVLEMVASNRARYVPAHCAVYPESRFIRRHTIESAARSKDARYFSSLIADDYKIDPEAHVAAVLNAIDGSSFDPTKPIAHQKEVIVCGASRAELDVEQDQLVERNIYPESLEIGTLVTLGAVMDYMRWKDVVGPTLVLELTSESANLSIVSRNQVDMCRPIPQGISSMFPLIQKELGLKDEESARKLFYSNTFDFTEMGPVLLRRMLRELQASTGFYEVQTGESVGQILLPSMPRNLAWVQGVLAKALGVPALSIDFHGWLSSLKISAGPGVDFHNLESRWLTVFGLMTEFKRDRNGVEEK